MAELPEDWKFLAQGEEWEAPSELRSSSRSSAINLLLGIASSDLIGNDVLEVVGRMLSSYAALSAWLSMEGAGELGFEGMSRVGAEISFVVRDVYSAWTAYREVFEPTRRVGIGEIERSALRLALEDGVRRLDGLRHADE
jgi:hypothetical protein